MTIYANATILGGNTVIGRARSWAATPGSPSPCRPGRGSGSPAGSRRRSRPAPSSSCATSRRRSSRPSARSACCACWPGARTVERAFFAGKGRELPRPEYRVPPEHRRGRRPVPRAQGDGAGRQRDRAFPARHLRRVRDRGAHAGGGRDARLLSSRGRALRAARQPDRRSQDHQPRSGASTSRRWSTAWPGGRRSRARSTSWCTRRRRWCRCWRSGSRAFFPGLDIRRRAGRRHRGEGGGRRRRRPHQARGAVLARAISPSWSFTRGTSTSRRRSTGARSR